MHPLDVVATQRIIFKQSVYATAAVVLVKVARLLLLGRLGRGPSCSTTQCTHSG
jgi:hypothetical protein